MNAPYYAVYSFNQECANKNFKSFEKNGQVKIALRYVIYEKEDGTQVKATEISKSNNFQETHKQRFKDSVFLGKVVKHVKSVLW